MKRLYVKEKIAILSQGSLNSVQENRLRAEIEELLLGMERIALKELLKSEGQRRFMSIIRNLRATFDKTKGTKFKCASLSCLTGNKKRVYQEVFSLIYECSGDSGRAKELIDRVLARLNRR
jgi:molecular chaperone HtpG